MGSIWLRRFRVSATAALVLAVVGSFLAVAPALPAAASPGRGAATSAAGTPVVDGRVTTRKASVPDDPEAASVAPGTADRPDPQSDDVEVGPKPVEAGDSGISLSEPSESASNPAATDRSAPDSVTVKVLDSTDTRATGASGFAFSLDRSDGATDPARVGVSVDYSAFADAYGGDYASRVILRKFPACVLDTPEDPACSKGTTVSAENDPTTQTITANLTADGDSADSTPADPGATTTTWAPVTSTTEPNSDTTTTSAPQQDTTTSLPGDTTTTTGATEPSAPNLRSQASRSGLLAGSSGGSVFAVTSAVSGSTGSYAATSLQQTQRWQAGGSSGTMSWSYPIEAPKPSIGAAPNLSLDYSSQAVDGMTPGANSQPGDVGLGWSIGGLGYIERRYRPCFQDGTGWANADLCWHSNNATISLNGTSSELIPTSTSGEWRLQDDPNWRVQHLTGAPNDDADNHEYWIVTTPDGVQYWFGYGQEPDSHNPTNSAWTVPVYANNSGEPCYNANVDLSYCAQQAWRWNLDRIVDPNDNLTSIFWTAETNRYGRQGYPSRSTSYVRGGAVSRIEYSKSSGTQHAPGLVKFFTSDRCTEAFGDTPTSCPAMTSANASHWPDVPVDLVCTSTTSCDDYSPSFFTTKRISSIWTSTYSTLDDSSQYVDAYALTQTLPTNPSGTGEVKLWLDRIQRVGVPVSGANLASPPVDFDGTWLANRADFDVSAGVQPANMPRVSLIREELGGETSFSYGQPNHPCTDKDGPWDVNDQYCFPVYFKPDGQPAGWAVNNRWVVTAAVATDVNTTTPGPVQATFYSYLDAPAWHYTDDPVMPSSAQTWSDYRGHSKVKTTTGTSVTSWLYYRGMDGDKLIGGGTKSVSVVTSSGTSSTDSDWLAGGVREERQLATDGTELAGSTTGYRAAVTAGPDSLGRSARNVQINHVVSRKGGKTLDTATTYQSGTNLPVTVEESWQSTIDATTDHRCTQTTYAAPSSDYLINYIGRVTVDGDCSAPYERVTDTFYDGHSHHDIDAPINGNATKVVNYNAATLDDTPTGGIATLTQYDTYGRTLAVTSPKGVVTSTSYNPSGAGLTRGVTTTEDSGTGGLAYVSTSEPDIRRGEPNWTKDAGGNVTHFEYDPLGRSLSVSLPGDPDGSPSYQFTYTASHSGQSRVKTRRRVDAGKYTDSYAYVDSFGRDRQTQTVGANGTDRLVTSTTYDSRGLVLRTSSPYVASGGPSDGMVADASPPPNTQLLSYDELGRQTSSVSRHGTTAIATSSTSYSGYDTTTTSPEGRKRISTSDVFGQTVRVDQRKKDGSHYVYTYYAYDHSGLLASITNSSNVTTYTYDHLGRRTGVSDPDTGTSSSTYDADSNVYLTTDGNGHSLYTELDSLGRPKVRHQGTTASGAKVAEWSYATSGAARSRLQSTTSYDGSSAYSSTTNSWDALGRPTSQTVSIPSSAGSAIAGDYTNTATYDDLGNAKTIGVASAPASVTPPAVAAMPSEMLTYSYDANERPTSMTASLSTDPIVSATGFRSDGLLSSRTYGAATDPNRVVRSYAYDADTLKLSTIGSRFGSSSPFQTDTYRYDLDGNVTATVDGSAAQTQCFSYDDQNRLTQAWTSTASDTCTDIASANLTAGPDPYKALWSYDARDNITTTTFGTTSPVTRTFAYSGVSAGPHATTSISTTASGVSPDTFTYDAGGELTGKSVHSSPTESVSHVLAWDSLGHLISDTPTPSGGSTCSVTSSANCTTGSVYDVDGNRLLRRVSDGSGGQTTTLYLPGQEVIQSPSGAVTAVRTYADGGSSVATRDASGLHWLLPDGQGSAQITVDAGTSTSDRQRYLPYGAARPSASDLAHTDRGYLGKVLDDSTGVVSMGARPYDPDLGTFLSADPMLNPDDPQTLNPYAYALDNPTTKSDPSGLFVPVDNSNHPMPAHIAHPVHNPPAPSHPTVSHNYRPVNELYKHLSRSQRHQADSIRRQARQYYSKHPSAIGAWAAGIRAENGHFWSGWDESSGNEVGTALAMEDLQSTFGDDIGSSLGQVEVGALKKVQSFDPEVLDGPDLSVQDTIDMLNLGDVYQDVTVVVQSEPAPPGYYGVTGRNEDGQVLSNFFETNINDNETMIRTVLHEAQHVERGNALGWANYESQNDPGCQCFEDNINEMWPDLTSGGVPEE